MSECQIPPKFTFFHDLDYEGIALNPLDHRIFHRLVEGFGKPHLLAGRELLIAEELHEVIEQRLPNCADCPCIERPTEIDTLDFGAKRSGNACDTYVRADFRRVSHGRPHPARAAYPPQS